MSNFVPHIRRTSGARYARLISPRPGGPHSFSPINSALNVMHRTVERDEYVFCPVLQFARDGTRLTKYDGFPVLPLFKGNRAWKRDKWYVHRKRNFAGIWDLQDISELACLDRFSVESCLFHFVCRLMEVWRNKGTLFHIEKLYFSVDYVLKFAINLRLYEVPPKSYETRTFSDPEEFWSFSLKQFLLLSKVPVIFMIYWTTFFRTIIHQFFLILKIH